MKWFKEVTKEAYDKQNEVKPYKVEEIGEIGGVKYKNAVNYDFVCPHSGEGFMEGDMSFSTLSYKRWEHSTPAIITDTKLRMFKNHPVLTERLAYFHTKEDAIKWNKDKFGEKETPKTKTAEQLQKELDALKLLISKEEVPSKEEWFKGICSDLKVRIDADGTINWVNSENKLVFYDSKSDYFYVRYTLIWIVLETKYGMACFEIQEFIKSQLLSNRLERKNTKDDLSNSEIPNCYKFKH